MRGLTVIVGGGAAAAGVRSALTLVLAQAALGGGARLFLHDAAVATAIAPVGDIADLLGEALGAGVAVTLCQTGLAAAGASAAVLDARFDYGGMVSLLAGLGNDRLVTF